jgi:hypothetical protein
MCVGVHKNNRRLRNLTAAVLIAWASLAISTPVRAASSCEQGLIDPAQISKASVDVEAAIQARNQTLLANPNQVATSLSREFAKPILDVSRKIVAQCIDDVLTAWNKEVKYQTAAFYK